MTYIVGESDKYRVDCNVIDVTNGELPEKEEDIQWDVQDFTYTKGVTVNPYARVNFGHRHTNHLSDDLKVSTRWAGVLMKVIPVITGTPHNVTDVLRDGQALKWGKSPFASSYDLYLGTDEDAVSNATPTDTDLYLGNTEALEMDVDRLDLGAVYYWRVDEISTTETRMNVWSFEVEPETIPISGVTVTASDLTEDPNALVDGSGLGMIDSVYVHNNLDTTMWKSGLDPQHPITVTFDLGSAQTISDMVIWNYNLVGEVAYGLGFGAQDINVETSLDGKNWELFGELTLNQGTGEVGYAVNNVIAMQALRTQYVKLTLKTNFSAFQKAIGLSEVQFTAIPNAPREMSPADGSTVSAVDMIVGWRAGRNAASHEILLGTDSNVLDVVKTMDYTVPRPSADLTEFLSVNTQYYWQSFSTLRLR